MKEYKRFTSKDPFTLLAACEDCEIKKEQGYCHDYQFYECENISKAIKKLGELEDKIENGTLIELPCKVDDKTYVINYNHELQEMVIIDYAVNKNGFIFYAVDKKTKDEYYLYDSDFNKDWFLIKAEAETKLKELKGEV